MLSSYLHYIRVANKDSDSSSYHIYIGNKEMRVLESVCRFLNVDKHDTFCLK